MSFRGLQNSSNAVIDVSADADTALEHAGAGKFLAYENRAKACMIIP